MVSQNTSEIAATNRGFVAQESVIAGASGPIDAGLPLPSFWGSVIAGTVVAMAIGSISGAFMLACHVGTTENGFVSFGPGAGAWIVITACVAYFIGGNVASRLSLAGGWLRGLIVWALSLPLSMLIAAFAAGGAGLAYAHTTHMAEQFTNNTGAATLYAGNMYINFAAAWVVFASMLCGLVFSIVGASVGCGCDNDRSQIRPDQSTHMD